MDDSKEENKIRISFDARKIGEDFGRGFSMAICKVCFLVMIIALGIYLFQGFTGFGMDSTDQDNWHRSNLTILTDHKTGIEYLSDGHGGLIKRGESP